MRTNATWVERAEVDAVAAARTRVDHSTTVRMVEPTPVSESPTYLGPKPAWLLRLYWWVFGVLFGQARLASWGMWWWNLPLRGWNMAKTILSADVDAETRRQRMEACGTCKSQHVRVHPSRGPKAYCGLCGCPEWKLAELRFKNQKVAWHCPRRRHPGPYPEDAWINKITESQREAFRAKFRREAKQGGCNAPGCGKGGG